MVKGYSIMQKIMIVDDDMVSLKLLKYTLDYMGYNVVQAFNGYDAVERAIEESPDLILMDLYLPDIDGLTALQAIRQDETMRKVPVVAITTSDFYEHRQNALKAGCQAFITKPVDTTRLAGLVTSLLSQKI
jgi:CheY-like chemotaxis protein